MVQLRLDPALAGESHLEGDSRERQFHDQSSVHLWSLPQLLPASDEYRQCSFPHGRHQGTEEVEQEAEL